MGAAQAQPVQRPPDTTLAARHRTESGEVHERRCIVTRRQESQDPQRRTRPGAGRQRDVQADVRKLAGVDVDPVEVGACLIPAADLEAVVVIVDHHTVVGDPLIEGDRAGMQERRMHQIHEIFQPEHPVGAPFHGLRKRRVALVGEFSREPERCRLVLADPRPQIAGLLTDGIAHADAGALRQRAGATLGRHRYALAIAVEPPVVIRALQLAADDIADRQPGAPVRTQVGHESYRAVTVAPRHQVLAE